MAILSFYSKKFSVIFSFFLLGVIGSTIFLFPENLPPDVAFENINQSEVDFSISVRMTAEGFSPKEVEINQGDTVTFANADSKPRWPASNIHPTHQVYPQFDPLQGIKPGESWNFRFEKAGEWRYHDHLYPEISGVITVVSRGVIFSSEKEAAEKNVENNKNSLPLPPAESVEAELSQVNMLLAAKNETELRSWLKRIPAKRVMQELLNDSGGGSTIDCHQEAHAIGKIAYEIYGPAAFRDGDAACHSGFYHGTMESFLAQKGTLNIAKDIEEICQEFATQFGRFECLHGVGHGVMAYDDYDLPQALKICGRLATDYEKSSCQGGVFMENIVAGQGLGAIRGHGTKWVNKEDPQFPCNAIDPEHSVQYQCWQMQTSWMLTLANYDFTKVATECLKVRPDMISVCFKSLGRDAAGHTLRNPQRIVEICDKVPRMQDYYVQCIIGAVNVIVDFWGERIDDRGTALCKIVSENDVKNACYQTLASRLPDVFTTEVERGEICKTFESSYQSYCVR